METKIDKEVEELRMTEIIKADQLRCKKLKEIRENLTPEDRAYIDREDARYMGEETPWESC